MAFETSRVSITQKSQEVFLRFPMTRNCTEVENKVSRRKKVRKLRRPKIFSSLLKLSPIFDCEGSMSTYGTCPRLNYKTIERRVAISCPTNQVPSCLLVIVTVASSVFPGPHLHSSSLSDTPLLYVLPLPQTFW